MKPQIAKSLFKVSKGIYALADLAGEYGATTWLQKPLDKAAEALTSLAAKTALKGVSKRSRRS